MIGEETILTREELEAAQRELDELKTVRRREIAEKLKEARQHGELSENSAYDEARDEQYALEERIERLEAACKRACVQEIDL